MMWRTLVAAGVLSIAAVLASQAHAPKVGRNGGPQVNAGAYHLEILPQGKVLRVFLRDHGDKGIDTQGFKGTAILTANGKAERITLTPAGDNTLQGEASDVIPVPPAGVVQITTSTGSTVQGKF